MNIFEFSKFGLRKITLVLNIYNNGIANKERFG